MNAARRLDLVYPPAGFAGLRAELAGIIGADAADALIGAWAGRNLYVPRDPGPEHPIVAIIGQAAATRLGEYMHGVRLEMPVTAAKRRRIVDLKDRGASNGRIAAELHCTERFVRKVLAEVRDAEADWQSGLFGTK